jgi:hypothetical protein
VAGRVLWQIGYKIGGRTHFPGLVYGCGMGRKVDDDLRLVAERLTPGGWRANRRSTLWHWMFKHAVAFEQLLRASQPTWKSVAEAMTALDLRDGSGKHPNAVRARKTWAEVKKAKSRRPKPRASLAHDQAVPSPAPVPPLPPQPSAADPSLVIAAEARAAARARMQALFKPVTIPRKDP